MAVRKKQIKWEEGEEVGSILLGYSKKGDKEVGAKSKKQKVGGGGSGVSHEKTGSEFNFLGVGFLKEVWKQVIFYHDEVLMKE